MKSFAIVAGAAGLVFAASAGAQVRITEWMYDGSNGEFVEFTNVGAAPVDLTGWSYDDDSATPDIFSLSGFGIVQPGESVVITEATEAGFRAAWNLPATVRILGGYTNNLGRADQINLFDSADSLVDRLTYGDQTFPGTIRTQGRSGVPTLLSVLGANNVAGWGFADTVPGGGPNDLSGVLPPSGFRTSTGGQTGNPGYFVIPAPGAGVALALSGLMIARRRRGA